MPIPCFDVYDEIGKPNYGECPKGTSCVMWHPSVKGPTPIEPMSSTLLSKRDVFYTQKKIEHFSKYTTRIQDIDD